MMELPPVKKPQITAVDTVVWIDVLPVRLLVGRKYKLLGMQKSNVELDSGEDKILSFYA